MSGRFFIYRSSFFPEPSLPVAFVPVPAFAVVYLGAVVTLGAYGCYNFGVSKLPASQATAFLNLIPVFTIILGWLILGEKFNPMQYLAAATVFAGVILSQDFVGGKATNSEA